MDKKVTGIIVAAGDSTRFGQNKNKNLFEVNEKPIIQYSIEVFNDNDNIDNIALVIKENEKKYFENIVNKMNLTKEIIYVIGRKNKERICIQCTKINSSRYCSNS